MGECPTFIVERFFTSFSFDKTEFIGKPPEGSIGALNEKVAFFGTLTIVSLDWLSERGFECLQQELREYDGKHLQHNQSGLTLQALYGDKTWKGSRLRVMIAGDKTLSAHFLTCEFGVLSFVMNAKSPFFSQLEMTQTNSSYIPFTKESGYWPFFFFAND